MKFRSARYSVCQSVDPSVCLKRVTGTWPATLSKVETHQIKIKKNGELRGIWPSYLSFKIANNKGADQTARMCRLVCAFVVRKQQSQGEGDMMLKHRLSGLRFATRLS